MPAVAVVAAIGTVSAGAAMGGVLGGIMIAGGVMSGVGAITGNKTLMKVGALASLGAGIGSAMGFAGAADKAWNSMVGGADSALGVTGKSFLDAGGSLEAIGNAIGRNNGATSGVDPGIGMKAKANDAVNGLGQDSGAPLTSGVGGPGLKATPSSSGLVDQYSVSSGATGGPSGLVAPRLGATSEGVQALGNASAVNQTTGTGGSFIDKSLSFIQKNPEVVKAGAGLVGGAMQSYSKQQEQQAILDAQAAARARYNNSILGQGWTRPAVRG